MNARRFIAVADRLGIEAICMLADATAPAQPLIGRGEALVAIDRVLSDEAVGRLQQHADRCLQMAELVTGVRAGDRQALRRSARDAHETMLSMHGVSPHAFADRVAEITAAPRRSVRVERAGHLTMTLGAVRGVLVARQRSAPQPAGAAYADPCGIEMLIDVDSKVSRGDIVALARDDVDPDDLAERLAPHFQSIVHAPKRDVDVDVEVVR